MKIERIDHLNLTVADIARSVAFYKQVLGMEAESMGEHRAALRLAPPPSVVHSPSSVQIIVENFTSGELLAFARR